MCNIQDIKDYIRDLFKYTENCDLTDKTMNQLIEDAMCELYLANCFSFLLKTSTKKLKGDGCVSIKLPSDFETVDSVFITESNCDEPQWCELKFVNYKEFLKCQGSPESKTPGKPCLFTINPSSKDLIFDCPTKEKYDLRICYQAGAPLVDEETVEFDLPRKACKLVRDFVEIRIHEIEKEYNEADYKRSLWDIAKVKLIEQDAQSANPGESTLGSAWGCHG